MAQEDAPRAGTAASAAKVILLVEDDVDTAQVITDLIAQETPHRVFVADCQGVLKFVRVIKPDLPLLDYLLPGTTGIALYDHLHANRTLVSGRRRRSPPAWPAQTVSCRRSALVNWGVTGVMRISGGMPA